MFKKGSVAWAGFGAEWIPLDKRRPQAEQIAIGDSDERVYLHPHPIESALFQLEER